MEPLPAENRDILILIFAVMIVAAIAGSKYATEKYFATHADKVSERKDYTYYYEGGIEIKGRYDFPEDCQIIYNDEEKTAVIKYK